MGAHCTGSFSFSLFFFSFSFWLVYAGLMKTMMGGGGGGGFFFFFFFFLWFVLGGGGRGGGGGGGEGGFQISVSFCSLKREERGGGEGFQSLGFPYLVFENGEYKTAICVYM